MEINNKEMIFDWLYLFLDDYFYDGDFGIDYLKKNIEIEIDEKNQLIVNSKISLLFDLSGFSLKELPINFGTINGTFNIMQSSLESFKGFPKIVNGDLIATNSNFNNTLEWNVKEVKGNINLCGQNTILENLNFLENTKFDTFYIKIKNSVFINDKSINEIDLYKNVILKNNTIFKYNEFRQILSYGLKEYENDFNDYINSFDKSTTKELV